MTENYVSNGVLLIRNSDIKDMHFSFSDKPIYLNDKFAQKNSNRKLKVGDVVTVHTGNIGTSSVIGKDEDGAIGFATINTRPNPKKIDSEFLALNLNGFKHKNYARRMSTGDGRSNYNLKDFNKVKLLLPTIQEQGFISDYFKTVNSLIAHHQQS